MKGFILSAGFLIVFGLANVVVLISGAWIIGAIAGVVVGGFRWAAGL